MIDSLFGQDTLVAIRDGSAVAFKQVFDACYEGLCHYAFTILKDEDEAEDIVQSMFVKLWERREDLDIKHTLKSYLFRSVYNQCLNQLEHKAVKNKYQSYNRNMPFDVEHPVVFPEELDNKIKQAIGMLPPQCRTIFMMSRYEEMRHTEIAEKLNISVNTIQNQICKALKILREELKEIIV
jgi:RNA polymerase sigma-70 factor (ECF subfamily)